MARRFQPHRFGLSGGRNHLAVECDGDRALSSDQSTRDMERQTTLERLGWRLARVRGSLFYRDPERAMRRVIQALEQAGIEPALNGPIKAATVPTDAIDRVRRRAPEIRWMWGQRAKQQKVEAKVEAAAVAVVPAPAIVPAPPVKAVGGMEAVPSVGGPPVVEVGDWVEFILMDAPADKQYVNIISGPTDVDQSAFSADEPLALALLGTAVHQKAILDLGGAKRELEVLQIHKPRKQHGGRTMI